MTGRESVMGRRGSQGARETLGRCGQRVQETTDGTRDMSRGLHAVQIKARSGPVAVVAEVWQRGEVAVQEPNPLALT